MREILFRGKRKDNGKWVEGHYGEYYSGKENVSCISIPKETISGSLCYDVIPETVGQYTGLTDKNDTKIFEGDIVKHIQKYEISGEVKSIAVIKWNEAYSCWSVEYTNGRITAFLGTEYHKLEVIGNAHNNPELLEGKA